MKVYIVHTVDCIIGVYTTYDRAKAAANDQPIRMTVSECLLNKDNSIEELYVS